MALRELSPLPTVRGPSLLGSVLMDASNRYAQTARQDQLLDRQDQRQDEVMARQNQRQDELLAGEREFRTTERKAAREENRLDAQGEREAQTLEVAIRALINEGLRNNPQRVTEAFQKAKETGLEALYQNLLAIPGPDGTPLLTIEDLDDPVKVKAAKDAYHQMRSSALIREQETRVRAQEDADALSSELTRVMDEEARVLSQLQEISAVIESGGAPTISEVNNRARQMALQDWKVRKKSGQPGDREIEAQIPAAEEQLRQQKLNNALDRESGLRRQLELVKSSRASVSRSLDNLRDQKVYPDRARAPSMVTEPQAAAPTPVSSRPPMGGFLRTWEAEAGMLPPPAAGAVAPAAAPTVAEPVVTPPAPAVAAPRPPVGRILTPGSPEEIAARAQIEEWARRDSQPLFPNAIWNTPARPGGAALPNRGNPIIVDPQTSTDPGRPITPSANIFPSTPPWWRTAV
jgi:hypothetical protein